MKRSLRKDWTTNALETTIKVQKEESDHIYTGPMPITWVEESLASKVCAVCDCLTWSRGRRAVRSIWQVSSLQAWWRHPQAQLHTCGVDCWRGCQHKMANQLAPPGATSEPMSKQRWREFKRRNMITGLNCWPLKSEPSLMCIHDCRAKRQGQGAGESIATYTHTHRHYRVVNLCFWWVDPFIVLWGRK